MVSGSIIMPKPYISNILHILHTHTHTHKHLLSDRGYCGWSLVFRLDLVSGIDQPITIGPLILRPQDWSIANTTISNDYLHTTSPP